MSLWTPSGEHPVGDEGRGQGPRDSSGGAGGTAPPGVPRARRGSTGSQGTGTGGPGWPESSGTDVSEADVEALRRQLADAPAEVVIANHCYGMFELAAVYLSQQPPRLDGARLAIDALGALVDGLGDRLGDAHPSLRDGLAQLRLAYVQISSVAEQGGDVANGVERVAGTDGDPAPAPGE